MRIWGSKYVYDEGNISKCTLFKELHYICVSFFFKAVTLLLFVKVKRACSPFTSKEQVVCFFKKDMCEVTY